MLQELASQIYSLTQLYGYMYKYLLYGASMIVSRSPLILPIIHFLASLVLLSATTLFGLAKCDDIATSKVQGTGHSAKVVSKWKRRCWEDMLH